MTNQCEKYHQCKPTQLDENLVIPIIELAREADKTVYEWYFTFCMGLVPDGEECPRKGELE